MTLPTIIFELKYDDSAQSAINQTKSRDYVKKIREDTDDILLVGINYDKKTKKHESLIERWRKWFSFPQTLNLQSFEIKRE